MPWKFCNRVIFDTVSQMCMNVELCSVKYIKVKSSIILRLIFLEKHSLRDVTSKMYLFSSVYAIWRRRYRDIERWSRIFCLEQTQKDILVNKSCHQHHHLPHHGWPLLAQEKTLKPLEFCSHIQGQRSSKRAFT